MSVLEYAPTPEGRVSIASLEKKNDTVVSVEAAPVQLERNFSFWACLGLAFALLNSWTAMAAALGVVLPTGGSVAMVWGLLVSAVGTLLMALSLAEICHVFPLSGGQYDWTYCIAPDSMKNGLSFFVGWMGVAGWTALYAAASSLGVQFVVGNIQLWHETYEAERWHVFLILIAFTLGATSLNTFGVRFLPLIDWFAGVWAIAGLIISCIVLLACSSGEFAQPKAVFATFTNETGWPNGFAFILGLLQSTLGLTAFDAASHMVEELPQPAKNAPRIMVLAVILGSITSWIFMVVLLFCIRDWEAVVAAPTGPLLQIYYQATSSRAGATCLCMFNMVAMALCINAVSTVSSRMLLSFARDRGLGALSRFFAPVHPKLKSPVWCLAFCFGWVVVFGCIYLGSTVAFNAILSVSILLLQISYVVPIIIVFWRGEAAFGSHSRKWSLGRWRRPVNFFAIIFALVTGVCFIFPPAIPITGESMNYAIVVFAIVCVFAGCTWVIDGRKNFTGPSNLTERLQAGKNA